jgi:hypothetical protein
MLLPGVGPQVTDPGPFLADCLAVSRSRERHILSWAAQLGSFSAWSLAELIRGESGEPVDPAAAHAVLAHLVWLTRQGRLTATGAPTLASRFELAQASREASQAA